MKTYSHERSHLPNPLRREVMLEAGFECAIPNCHEKMHLEVHHINGNREDNRKQNLIPLCRNHHAAAEAGHIDRLALQQIKQMLSTSQETGGSFVHSTECDRINDFISTIRKVMSYHDGYNESLIYIEESYWLPECVKQKIRTFLNDETWQLFYAQHLRSHDTNARARQDEILSLLKKFIQKVDNSKYSEIIGGSRKFIPLSAPGTRKYDEEIEEQKSTLGNLLQRIYDLLQELQQHTTIRL